MSKMSKRVLVTLSSGLERTREISITDTLPRKFNKTYLT